jgi:hypothetical protein
MLLALLVGDPNTIKTQQLNSGKKEKGGVDDSKEGGSVSLAVTVRLVGGGGGRQILSSFCRC